MPGAAIYLYGAGVGTVDNMAFESHRMQGEIHTPQVRVYVWATEDSLELWELNSQLNMDSALQNFE